jgi:hypothetical protein
VRICDMSLILNVLFFVDYSGGVSKELGAE